MNTEKQFNQEQPTHIDQSQKPSSKLYSTAFLASGILFSMFMYLFCPVSLMVAVIAKKSVVLGLCLIGLLYISILFLGCFICKIIGKGILKSNFHEQMYFRKIGRITSLAFTIFLVMPLFLKVSIPHILTVTGSFCFISAVMISALGIYIVNLLKIQKKLIQFLALLFFGILSLAIAVASFVFFSTMKFIVPLAAVFILVLLYCADE